MSNRLGFSNRVRYAIQHDQWGYQEISEPVNWREDDKELKRNSNKDFSGIVSKISASIVFTKRGFETIAAIYDSYGANSTTRLIKEAKDAVTDEWYRVWDGSLDFTTLDREDSMVSCKFNADDLEAIIKSRKSEKYEVERTTDLFGNDIEPIAVRKMLLDGRKILLESKLGVREVDKDLSRSVQNSRSGDTKRTTSALPMYVEYESDQNVHEPTINIFYTGNEGRAELNFYNDADRDRKLNVTVGGDLRIEVQRVEDVRNAYFAVQLIWYSGAENFIVKDRFTLWESYDVYGLHNKIASFSDTFEIDMLQGDSLGLVYYQQAKFPNWTNFRDGEITLNMKDVDVAVSISEDSFIDPTQSDMVLPHDVFGKLIEIVTGRDNAFYSEALGRTDIGYTADGIDTGALCGLAHGLWKRQFSKIMIYTSHLPQL